MLQKFTCLILFILFPHSTEANFEDTRCRCICPSTEFFRAHNNTPDENFRRYYTKTNVNSLKCNTHNVVKQAVKGIVDENRLDAFLANCNCKFESRNSILLKDVVLLVIVVMLVLAGYMTYLLALNPAIRHNNGGGHAGNQFIPYRRQEDDVGFSSAPSRTFWFHTKDSDSDYESDAMEDNVFANCVDTALGPAAINTSVNSTLPASSSSAALSPNRTATRNAGDDDAIQLRGGGVRGSFVVFDKVESEQNKWISSVEEQRRKVLTDHTMLN